jgi:hypothetical protein
MSLVSPKAWQLQIPSLLSNICLSKVCKHVGGLASSLQVSRGTLKDGRKMNFLFSSLIVK